ncbi:MAG: major facilitator superfamily domain-containing protein 6 [Anaerolineae bacterium]
MSKIWPFSLNFLCFAAVAFSMPFVVLYYQSVGFDGTQIGLIMGLTPLVTLVSAPLWTGLADATRRHRLLMSAALLVGACSIALLPSLTTFLPILLLALVFSTAFAPVSSFIDSATMFMLGQEKQMYGRIRVGGTLGFGLAATLAGVLVQNYGLKVAFWGAGILYLGALVLSQKLVHRPAQEMTRPRAGARTLLMNRHWLFFLALAFAGGLSLAVTNNYLFPYMKQLGSDETTMGLALTAGTLSEIPVLFFGNRLIQRFHARGLLLLAMILTGIRLLAFSLVNAPGLVLLLQLLNGPTFPAMWLAGVAYADEHAPAGMRATAQGLFSAMVFGFGMAVGSLIGGPLLESLGGHTLFLVFGVLVLAVVLLVVLLESRLPAPQQTLPEPP